MLRGGSSIEFVGEFWDSGGMHKMLAKEVIAAQEGSLKQRIAHFTEQKGRPPCLGVILVGEDPASQVYVKNKIQRCADYGFASQTEILAANTTQGAIEELVIKWNQSELIDAYLVQLPLPQNIDSKRIVRLVAPQKDADGFTFESLGRLMAHQSLVLPCTPAGILKLLNHYQITLSGSSVVVVGRSSIVGNPVAQLLLQQDATVTVCHSRTKNLSHYTQSADIVVVAAGKRHLLSKKDFKKGAVVIDVGIHRSGPGLPLAGDVNPEGLEGYLSHMTPVPGGVGPLTIFCLLENTMTLAEAALSENV